MPNILIDDATAPTPDSLRELAARLQGRAGTQHAFGRWTRFLARDLKITVDNAAAGGAIAISGDGGYISFINLGETAMMEIDIDLVTTGGAAARVLITFPDGYSFYPRNMLRNGTQIRRAVGTLAINSNGALSTGLVLMGIPKANQALIQRDLLATAFNNGALGMYGQVAFENMFQMEHQ